MNVLIITLPGDLHSFVVKEALELRGHEVLLVSWSDFPQMLSVSSRLGHQSEANTEEFTCKHRIKHNQSNLCFDHFDIVWNHRTLDGTAPSAISSRR